MDAIDAALPISRCVNRALAEDAGSAEDDGANLKSIQFIVL